MSAGATSVRRPPPTRRRSNGSLTVGYNPASVVGGGFLRTGCGPGPLEPDLDNPSEGNTAGRSRPHPHRGAAVLVSGDDVAGDMKITVNGKPMELDSGTTVEGLLKLLGVPRQ